MDWRSRIVADPNVLVGKPVIKGTRISVELVMDLLAAGYTADQSRIWCRPDSPRVTFRVTSLWQKARQRW